MATKFKQYFSGLNAEQKNTLAADAGTSVAYLFQVASGHRNAGAALIRRLMQADRNITFEMMDPDNEQPQAVNQ